MNIRLRLRQQTIHEINRALPIMSVTTLDAQVAGSHTNREIIARLSVFFGSDAVSLSCIGLYGLMSYLVSRRTGEIGVRIALGAGRTRLDGVIREVSTWILAGILIGLPVTLDGGRIIQKMLRGTDPPSLIAAVIVLLLSGLAAGFLAARRASRVDPAVRLQYE